MRAHPLQTDDRAMSGQWQAFFLIIGFAFGFPLVNAIWPIATHETFAGVLGFGLTIFKWLLDGTTGYILVYGFVIVGWIMVIGAIYMAIEQVYLWIKGRGEDTVNEYQIK